MPLPRLAFPHELGLDVATKGAEIALTITATVPAGQGLAFADLGGGQIVPYFKADPAQLPGTATATVTGPFPAFIVHFAGGSVEQLKLKAGDKRALSNYSWTLSADKKLMVRRTYSGRLVVMATAPSAGRLTFTVNSNATPKTITATLVADATAAFPRGSAFMVGGELANAPSGHTLKFGESTVAIFDDQAPDHVIMDLALAASTLG